MIRHVVLFRWKPGFDPTGWFAVIRGLEERIPEVKALSVGSDVLHADRSWDAAIVADFDRLEDVATYTVHPEHQPAVEMSRVGAEQIVSVDFELPDAARRSTAN